MHNFTNIKDQIETKKTKRTNIIKVKLKGFKDTIWSKIEIDLEDVPNIE